MRKQKAPLTQIQLCLSGSVLSLQQKLFSVSDQSRVRLDPLYVLTGSVGNERTLEPEPWCFCAVETSLRTIQREVLI